MHDSSTQVAPQTAVHSLVTTPAMAAMLKVSRSFLDKDRRGAQLVPFIKLGDLVFYDPEEVFAALKAMSQGGPRGRRTRRAAVAEQAPGAHREQQ